MSLPMRDEWLLFRQNQNDGEEFTTLRHFIRLLELMIPLVIIYFAPDPKYRLFALMAAVCARAGLHAILDHLIRHPVNRLSFLFLIMIIIYNIKEQHPGDCTSRPASDVTCIRTTFLLEVILIWYLLLELSALIISFLVFAASTCLSRDSPTRDFCFSHMKDQGYSFLHVVYVLNCALHLVLTLFILAVVLLVMLLVVVYRSCARQRRMKEQLVTYPIQVALQDQILDSCSICLENYQLGDQFRSLPCNHKYHVACIDPWLLNNNPVCPICRLDMIDRMV